MKKLFICLVILVIPIFTNAQVIYNGPYHDTAAVYQDNIGEWIAHFRSTNPDQFIYRRYEIQVFNNSNLLITNYYREQPWSLIDMITWEYVINIDSFKANYNCVFFRETKDTNTVELNYYQYNMDTIDRYYTDTTFIGCMAPQSIEEVPQTALSIYPCPLPRGAQLHLETESREIDRIQLLDLLGRPLYQWESSPAQRYTLPSYISTGQYYLRIHSPEVILHRQLMVE